MKNETDTVLLNTLKARFLKNRRRHPDIDWASVEKKLADNPGKIRILEKMETTGGEPDVTGFDADTHEYIFCDCSSESPAGRRSLCYDEAALDARKENKPEGSAVGLAEAMGIEILTEEIYRKMQETGEYDRKTSSWVKTPDEIRNLGGALFCDRRYNTVFAYHNGVESYYSSRGFRGFLKV